MTRSKTLVAGLILCVAATTQADDQIFQYGSKKAIRGTIGTVTKDFVEIKARSGPPKKIPADTIRRVRFNGETPQLNLARSNEESGLLTRALESYTSLLGSLKSAAKSDTEFLIARTKCRMAIVDPTKVDEAIASMKSMLAKNANGFRHYECLLWLGRVHVAKGDFPTARSRFDQLGKSTMKSHQMLAKVATGNVLLRQNKPAEAQTSYEQVIGMQAESPSETASQFEAVLGKATCARLQKNFSEAIKSLDDIIQNTDRQEQSELHARAYVQKGDCYRDQQNAKMAVFAYLHLDIIEEYRRAADAHAEALFQLSQLWPSAGHPNRGAEAAAKLKKLYPNNTWTKKLAG